MNIREIIDKYEMSVLKNIDKDNMIKIITFLQENKVIYIEDIIENYLDIFTIPYDEFIEKFSKLNKKYNNELVNMLNDDVNVLEEIIYE